MPTATRITPFDRYAAMTDSRMAVLKTLLPSMAETHQLRSALDLGCGVGVFSAFLSSLGFDVTGVDVREKNVEEAVRRYPQIPFRTLDAEDARLGDLGIFDLVLCLGLLYHLENPMLAIRNLARVTGRIAVIETRIAPHRLPIATLIDEKEADDQSVRCVAFYPSEPCLVKMCYRAGFRHVYHLRPLPDHPEFRQSIGKDRLRTMVVAAHEPVESPQLVLASNPPAQKVWEMDWGWHHRVRRLLAPFRPARR